MAKEKKPKESKPKKQKEKPDLFTALSDAVGKANFTKINNVIKKLFEDAGKQKLEGEDLNNFLRTSLTHPTQGAYIWNKTISEKADVFDFVLKCLCTYGKKNLGQSLEIVLLTEDPYQIMPVQTALLTSLDSTRSICDYAGKVADREKREALINEIKNRKNSDELNVTDMQESWNEDAKKIFNKKMK